MDYLRKGSAIHHPPPATSGLPRRENPDWTAAQSAIRTIASKWTIPVVAALRAEPLRYTDLHRAIGPAVSQKVLAETLHRMEKEGLIVRLDRFEDTPRAAFTARGAYELTDFAKALEAHLEALGNWHTAQRSKRSQ